MQLYECAWGMYAYMYTYIYICTSCLYVYIHTFIDTHTTVRVRLQEQNAELHEESLARMDLQVEACFRLVARHDACDVS